MEYYARAHIAIKGNKYPQELQSRINFEHTVGTKSTKTRKIVQ